MQFCDRSVLAGTKIREDGAMIADVRIARTGVQLYLGREVDPDNSHNMRDARVVRMYRPGTEVFSEETLKSAAHRPVSNGHPKGGMIDAANWKEHAVGNTADEVGAEGIYIRVPLMVSDAATIKEINNGKREVSAGYTSTIDWVPGETDNGEKYDCVQRNIRINHVAIVQHGRAGSKVRIGDEAAWGAVAQDTEGEETMSTSTRQVTVDGITIEVTDQGAQVIEKLQKQLSDANSASVKVLADHATALAARDKDIATRDATIDDLKKKVLDAAAIDKLVAERAELVGVARLVAKDAKFDGLDAGAIRKAAVIAVLGDAAVKDKSQDYVDARFDILAEDARKKGVKTADKFAETIRSGGAQVSNDENPQRTAYTKMVTDLNKPTTAVAN